jgi:hypothetical protein
LLLDFFSRFSEIGRKEIGGFHALIAVQLGTRRIMPLGYNCRVDQGTTNKRF